MYRLGINFYWSVLVALLLSLLINAQTTETQPSQSARELVQQAFNYFLLITLRKSNSIRLSNLINKQSRLILSMPKPITD